MGGGAYGHLALGLMSARRTWLSADGLGGTGLDVEATGRKEELCELGPKKSEMCSPWMHFICLLGALK